jgi:hypothetical protein
LTVRAEPWRSRVSQDKQIVAVLLLLTVAIVAYLDGHGHSSGPPVERSREASNAVTVINYDAASGWRPASRAPKIPGLTIGQPLVVGPGGDGARSGLVVGKMLDSEFGPVPPQLLAEVRQPPDTQVVDLLNTQAYRYSGLTVTSTGMTLTLYTIPTSASSTTAIVCYAQAGSSSDLQACERLAGTLTIATSSPQTEVRTYQSLTPQLAFGKRISAVAARVQTLLRTVRPELHQGASKAASAAVAKRLADGLGGAAGSLVSVSPPPAAARAQGSLLESLARAREAYSALAAALQSGDETAYTAALTQIYAAEASLSSALKNFGLLAYK